MSDPSELIDEQARRQFESDWKSNSVKEIETYLPEPDDDKYWPTLEELLYIDLEFSWKEFEKIPFEDTVSIDRSPTSRLKRYSKRLNLEQHRDLLERLQDYERSLAEKSRNRKAAQNIDQPDSVVYETLPVEGIPPQTKLPLERNESGGQEFGDYQLFEMLGRGGMGVVFKARERKTGRFVALKMIRSNVINRVDPETKRIVIDRFQTEARAVANIEHPNIVTLFEVDQHEETPFISMQWVDGEDLATRIRQSILDSKTAARYIQAVAEAIAAAHEKGIIHRDLKPHNILLDNESDRPLVTDFGLAKLTSESSDLTETGELLGTPGYMSPEQATGQSVDAATDIYSLGATLYCLIGGRAPFQAADTLKTIEQIVKNPPIAPREVNPDVDFDLNTICLKCLEKDPARRYATAKDLADDLSRYLEGRPILARPLGPVQKSVRWCKRNPLPTTVFVSLSLLILVSVLGILWTRHYSNQNRRNAQLAFESNRQELSLIADDVSLQMPGMKDTRQQLLNPLKNFFEEFIELNGSNQEYRAEYAFAFTALGIVAFELGNLDDAIEQLTHAVDIQTELVKDSQEPRLRLDLSNSLNLRGECRLKRAERDQALADFAEAYLIREQLVSEFPDNLEYLRKLANLEMNLANWHAMAASESSLKRSITYLLNSNKLRQRVLDSETIESDDLRLRVQRDQAEALFNLAASHEELAYLNQQEDELEVAIQYAESSLKLFEAVRKRRPRWITVTRDSARCALKLADLNNNAQAAFVLLGEYSSECERILQNYPEELEYGWESAASQNSLGDLSLRMGNFPKSKQHFSTAYQNVAEKEATTPRHQTIKLQALIGMAMVHAAEKNKVEGQKVIQQARSLFESISKENGQRFKPFDQQIRALEVDLSI